MRDFAPEQFDTYAKFLFDNYAKRGLSVRQAVHSEMMKHTNLRYDEAYEEVVARLSESFLRDVHLTEKSRELYNTDRNVWEKIRDGLQSIVERIERWMAGLSPESDLGKIGMKMAKENREILDRFVAGIKAASENAAYIKNTTDEGGVRMMSRENTKKDTQQSATSPLSRRSPYMERSLDYNRVVTAAADLGITNILSQLSEDVKRAIVVLSDIRTAIDNNTGVYGSKKAVSANNLIGILVSNGVFSRANNNESVYRHDGDKSVRISNHSAVSSYFKKQENLSIVLRNRGANTKFKADKTKNVVEAVFRKQYLNEHPESLKALLSDIGRFIATGIYEDHAGAQSINISGNVSKFYKQSKKDTSARHQDRDADYLSAVNRGDMQTAQKMVDEAAKAAGYTIKAYHGTPNGTFTVFKDWQYFTRNKEYADIYQNQGASSNGYKVTADNPYTYEVYLKGDHVFDTRNKECRDIFMNEFYRKWGNGAPLSEKGLPDWTDGDDLAEFFEENGYNYDVILLDEGATGGYGDEVKSRGVSYAVKDSSQVKSADPVTYDDAGNVIPLSERFNSEEKDIRYDSRDDWSDLI